MITKNLVSRIKNKIESVGGWGRGACCCRLLTETENG